MNHFFLFFRGFIAFAFRKKASFLVHFAVPPAAFLAMFLLLRSSGDAAFAGAQAYGLIVYFTMIQAVMVASLAMRDKEQGVLRRILVSPAPPLAYAAGNGAAAFAVLAAQVSLSSALSGLLLPPGSGLGFARLIPIFLCFAWTSVGFASLVCSLSGTSSGAMISANVIILFSTLLGGGFFPIEFMKPYMRSAAFAFPQYWAMRAIRLAQAASPPAESGLPLLVLVLSGFLFLAVQAAARRRSSDIG